MDKIKAGVCLFLVTALTGCEGLIIKSDDNVAATTGKVLSRTLLGVSTVGLSELSIAQTKEEVQARPRIVTSGSHSNGIKGQPPYKFLVWGNDSIAVGYLTDLFRRSGDTVVSPTQVHSLTKQQKIKWTRTSEDSTELLKVVKELNLDAIVFADVTGSSETRTYVHNTPGVIMPVGSMYFAAAPSAQQYSERLHHLRVSVQSISSVDGSVRWSGTATFNKPISNPDASIEHLTEAAIARALCSYDRKFKWVEPGPWVTGGCVPVD